MKAITLWQPWASLVACGAKKYETRSWPTNYRGPIAIHAAKRPFNTDVYLDRELHSFAEALQLPDIYSFEKLPYGCVIATAQLIGCYLMYQNPVDHVRYYLDEYDRAIVPTARELFFGDWAPGRYAWKLDNVKMLDNPIPAKGKQGLWNWEDGGVT